MIKTVHEDDLEAWYRLTELELGWDISITDFDLEDEDLLEVFSEWKPVSTREIFSPAARGFRPRNVAPGMNARLQAVSATLD